MSEILKKQLSDAEAAGRRIAKQLFEVEKESDALAAKLKEQDARIDDLLAICHRLALELECLLLDTKDLAPVSRWWDSAMAALDGWHKAKDAASVRPVPAERPTPATRPGWRDINDIVADREKDPSKAAALERARERLAAESAPVEPVNARLLERISDAIQAYERYGAICTFEGEPMIYASTLTEIAEIAAEAQQAEPVNARLIEALRSIQRYGLDTLSGRADGGDDDRAWQRAAVNEMTKRARIALSANGFKVEGEPVLLMEEEIHGVDKWLEDAPFWRVVKFARAIEAAVLRKQGYKVEG